jgi:uncharacterized protein YegP (UPF0339 family)
MANVAYPCYKEKKDNFGDWYWIYYARNGEEIARSSESYRRGSDCAHSIELIKNSRNDPVFYYD